MKEDLTEIVILLDRSGSMESIRMDTIGGINTFITDQKKASGQARVSLIQFDDRYEINYSAKDINEVQLLGLDDFVPRNSTALLDALGRTIDEVGARLRAIAPSSRPAKVLFVIMTDGLENASRRFGIEAVRQKIEHQTTVYNWQFVYLGANQDAFDVGNRLSIPTTGTITYAATAGGVNNVFASLSSNTTAYRGGLTKGYTFKAEDQAVQNEELLKNGTTTNTGGKV